VFRDVARQLDAIFFADGRHRVGQHYPLRMPRGHGCSFSFPGFPLPGPVIPSFDVLLVRFRRQASLRPSGAGTPQLPAYRLFSAHPITLGPPLYYSFFAWESHLIPVVPSHIRKILVPSGYHLAIGNASPTLYW